MCNSSNKMISIFGMFGITLPPPYLVQMEHVPPDPKPPETVQQINLFRKTQYLQERGWTIHSTAVGSIPVTKHFTFQNKYRSNRFLIYITNRICGLWTVDGEQYPTFEYTAPEITIHGNVCKHSDFLFAVDDHFTFLQNH